MEYNLKFVILVFFSAFLGISIGIINNNLLNDIPNIETDFIKKENDTLDSDNLNYPDNKTENNSNKNDLITKSDLLDEDEEEKEKKKEKEKEKQKEKESEKEQEKEKEKEKEEEKKKEEEKEKKNEEKKEEKSKNNEQEKFNYIHIALTIDNKYFYPLLVFLTSLLDNRAPSTFYIIHIMTSKNLNKEYFDKINLLISLQGKDVSNVTFYNMGDDFRGAITGSHISTAAYYRIALPSLLPYVDKIIYTDTDVINFKDLSEMYNLKFQEKKYFMGTLDQTGLLNELKSLGIYTIKYMNSGILLMNLKDMRRDGIEKKIRDFIFSHYLDHHDQTAINGACYDNLQILSFKYATFVFNSLNDMKNWNDKQNKLYRYNDEELRQAFYEPILLHYAGWVKPWDKQYSNINGEYWWYYAKKSGFYEEILNHYYFSKDRIEELLKKIPEDGGLLKRNYK